MHSKLPVARLRLVALLLSALLATACGQRADTAASPFHASDISKVEWGRDFSLTDAGGRQRSLSDFDDQVVMLFFGFTHCTDVCPTTLAEMARVMDRLGPLGERVQGLFVTVDPERDTAAVLANYLARFHPTFIGLYADPARTAAMAQEFKFFHAAHAPDARGDYAVEHGSAIYLYGPAGPNGRRRLLAGAGTNVDTLVADVKRLLEP